MYSHLIGVFYQMENTLNWEYKTASRFNVFLKNEAQNKTMTADGFILNTLK